MMPLPGLEIYLRPRVILNIDPQSWPFHTLPPWSNNANLHQNRFTSFENITLISLLTKERTKQVDDIMPPPAGLH